MDLGAFSISLAVKDISASRSFYEKLGFSIIGGTEQDNWLILSNREHVIGLFQGMFEQNILTFNPGWDQHGNELGSFTDIRQLQSDLRQQGIEPAEVIENDRQGPASFVIEDPDGNTILIDQHR